MKKDPYCCEIGCKNKPIYTVEYKTPYDYFHCCEEHLKEFESLEDYSETYRFFIEEVQDDSEGTGKNRKERRGDFE